MVWGKERDPSEVVGEVERLEWTGAEGPLESDDQ